MKAIETKLKGCFVMEPTIFEDKRGFFYESFHQERFQELIGEKISFIQDNQSFSAKGVLRGLHYQKGEFAQAKLIRVLQGVVHDVVVDIRKSSPTFGQHFSAELSSENKRQLFIPRGFAHGFVVLSTSATFFYKCDNFYNAASEGGIIYNDPTLNINWKLPVEELIVSAKDAVLPSFENAMK